MSDSPGKLSQFWRELKRRKVIKAMAMYAATAFIIIEASDIILPRLGLPDWTVTFLIILVLVGFPITIILSWVFDATPGGIERTPSIDEEELNIIPEVKRKRKFMSSDLIITALVIVVLILLYPKLFSTDKNVEKTIAVLPFANLSSDSEQEYFSDAMVDEILDRLSKVGGLLVSSRTSSMTYKGSNLSLKQIGTELGVSNIVEGSVRKIEDKVRIIVQLIDAKSDKHIWSETFDKDYTDIFNLTAEIAEIIANELKVALTDQEKQLVEKVPTENMDAYESYIIGRHHWRKFTPDDLNIALQYFTKASELDKDFALAYLGISDVYYGLYQLGEYHPTDPAPMENLYSALTKAVLLDSTLAEVHYSLSSFKTGLNWDWEEGMRELDIALSINPNYADAYSAYSNLLMVMGKVEESIEKINMAIKLDPNNIFTKTLYGVTMLFAREYDLAIQAEKEVLELDPNNFLAMQILAPAYHMVKNYEEEQLTWRSFLEAHYANEKVDIDHLFETDYTIENHRRIMNQVADTLVSQLENTYFDVFIIAFYYASAGMNDKALDMLELSYEMHNPNTPYLLNPMLDNLREYPRFKELLKKMNLTIE